MPGSPVQSAVHADYKDLTHVRGSTANSIQNHLTFIKFLKPLSL